MSRERSGSGKVEEQRWAQVHLQLTAQLAHQLSGPELVQSRLHQGLAQVQLVR